jgi:hypothetical protein
MHLIIAAFFFLGLAGPGSTIKRSEIIEHSDEIEQLQDETEFVDYMNQLTEEDGIFTVDIDEIH